ncbi:PAS domain S-box protein [Pelagibius litoralis]|uniref:histidine kinase n=1 Tax=Pelagibius litoralis TaxID=374515 RepID=A0A967K8L1_9PROT|nr:ATP-binding protein [Pelagibius litoralis]NIA69312.1 PAS domain S-box protein [Pelagibius litoralis]
MDIDVLKKRLSREKIARRQAESILESKSRDLFLASEQVSKSAQLIKAQSQQLQAVLDHAMAAIFLVDETDKIVRANRVAELTFEMSKEDLLNSNLFDLFSADAKEAARKYDAVSELNQATDTSDAAIESIGLRKNGTTFPMELSITQLDLDGNSFTVWICRDISSRKEAEEKRAKLEQELGQAQKLESLGTLASGIAHEINTPVQYVSDNGHFLKDAFADLMKVLTAQDALLQAAEEAGVLGDQAAEVRKSQEDADIDFLKEEVPGSIDQTLDGVSRISKIVTAVKEFSHPGTTEKTLVDLNSAIETTLTVARNEWKYLAKVETIFDDSLPQVPCLPGEFNQVILNMVVNAAHAIESSREGEELGEITIKTSRQNGMAEIRVSDSGCGISEENLKQIFDPFFTTKGVGKGTGQGLSIAYSSITQKHNGTISVESKLGAGTTFIVRIPLEEAAAMKEAG